MRGKRSKQYRKLMQQYGLTFGFRQPYQTLIDAQMIQDTHRFKMSLITGLETTLHGQVKPMITQCSIRHLYMLDMNSASVSLDQKTAFIDLAKTFERRRCNHHTLETPLTTLECFKDVIDPKDSGSNKNCYVIASQEEEVRRWARSVRGVPSIYVKRSVMVMEPMAEGSLGAREGVERGKLRAGVKRTAVGQKRKREDEQEGSRSEVDDIARKKKSKGPKGPNPLSVKKSKKKAVSGVTYVGVPDLRSKGSGVEGPTSMQLGEAVGDRKKRKRKHKPKSVEGAPPRTVDDIEKGMQS